MIPPPSPLLWPPRSAAVAGSWSGHSELGNQAGLSRATIFRIEKLEREVSMDQLVRIAAAFDTTAGKIIRQSRRASASSSDDARTPSSRAQTNNSATVSCRASCSSASSSAWLRLRADATGWRPVTGWHRPHCRRRTKSQLPRDA
ncbi:helix-turn-helix domain-containing protein [Rhodococcus hoagii]|nr:helix-turn-helix domain-containing protein [Prescottella equi]